MCYLMCITDILLCGCTINNNNKSKLTLLNMVVLVVELSSFGFIGMSCVNASYQREILP